MKEQESIPTSKVKRASRFVRTGLKVGGNYIRHYSKKIVKPELEPDDLHQRNAQEIYGTLSELKGSALKVAQMLSMDKGFLPEAFIEKFTQAQYRAPALSGPLVMKTLRQYLGQSPHELFDSFELQARHAASMGQVHQATKDGKTLAIKVQYPGVADSVVSDLKMVRPFARRMFNIQDAEIDVYFDEVKARLLEEADYELELQRSMEISERCAELEDVIFPT
jgi:predicted unusual protein kinase regulating ubiquinone biosynthesis (AarF/ABC1/UbiB family)